MRLEAIPGSVPHPLNLPEGCKFAPRCKYATAQCVSREPDLVQMEPDHWIRCYYAEKEKRWAKQKDTAPSTQSRMVGQ